MFKEITVIQPTGNLSFFFDKNFNGEAIKDSIKRIRVGESRNWTRPFRDAEMQVVEKESLILGREHKYITIFDIDSEKKTKYMVVFPKSINHDNMLEVIQHAAYQSDFPNDESPISCFSAGFIDTDRICRGKSETLSKQSDKADTDLFKTTFRSL